MISSSLEIFAGDFFFVNGVVGAQRFGRLQSRGAQQLLQQIRRHWPLEEIDRLEFNALLGQDTLDLAALGSRRTLVNFDLHAILA